MAMYVIACMSLRTATIHSRFRQQRPLIRVMVDRAPLGYDYVVKTGPTDMPENPLRTTLEELQIELEKLHFDNEELKENVDRSVAALESKLLDESSDLLAKMGL